MICLQQNIHKSKYSKYKNIQKALKKSDKMLKLSSIANNIQKQNRSISNSVVGVVIDVTRPLYRQKQQNYIVMIKIVDQSLNDQQLFGVMSKDCTVYLISKNKQQIDFVRSIGQIVLLDKFTFSLWNGIKLQTKYLNTIQGIYTVDASTNSNQLIIKKSLTMNPQLLDKSILVVQRVRALLQWRSTKLAQIYQPKIGVSILNNHCVMVQPFNMILRYQAKSNSNSNLNNDNNNTSMQQQTNTIPKQQQYILILKDLNDNTYTVKHRYQQFQQDDLILIRGIQSIGPSLQLILTQTGNILRFSYNIDHTVMNYVAIHRDNQKFITDKKDNQFTAVSCDNDQVTYIAKLLELQDKYNHSNRKEEIQISDVYFVKAIAVNYEGQLSMYHRDYQILLHDTFYGELSYEEKKEYKEYNRIGYVYEGILGLIDRSNQAKGKPYYVNLFTCDLSGNFITSEEFQVAEKAIGTNDQCAARKQLLRSINRKLTKITSQSTFAKPVALALEPIRSEKLLFRLANTRIL